VNLKETPTFKSKQENGGDTLVSSQNLHKKRKLESQTEIQDTKAGRKTEEFYKDSHSAW